MTPENFSLKLITKQLIETGQCSIPKEKILKWGDAQRELPLEIIRHIFSSLTTIKDFHSIILTCKTFFIVVYTPIREQLFFPSDSVGEIFNRAINIDSLTCVRLLLTDKRVDRSAKDNSAIGWASEVGHTEIVKLLLADKKVNPSARDNYAIGKASKRGQTEVVKMLSADKRVVLLLAITMQLKRQAGMAIQMLSGYCLPMKE